MTDTTDAIPANYTDTLTLSSDQSAAMRAEWVRVGLDPGQFDKAASGEPGAAPEAPADAPATEGLTNPNQPTMSAVEAKAMAEELIRAGVPPEQVEAALKADGYRLEDDTRTDEEIEHDRMFGAAPPEGYRLDYQGRVPAGVDPTTVAAANTEMTTWLSQAGFSPEIGPAVLERAMDAGQAYARMSDVDRQLWAGEQHAEFARMAGTPERAAELIDFASAALARGGDAFSNALAKSGALDDCGVLMHLAHQGERLAARGAK
jgi:hypothetical protein